MVKDLFDRVHLLGLAVVCAALIALLAMADSGVGATNSPGLDKAMEQELANQARVALLQKLYGPVESLRQQGQPQTALLKLDELASRYPGEAHGFILKGEILYSLGALEEAVASFVAGVRLNGDYVDQGSPLTRRTEIRQVVDQGLAQLAPRAKANPDNATLGAALKNVYYLQSRLAGGCE